MGNRKQTAQTLFLAVSSLGALFVLTEIVLKQFGASICVTEGCRMTAQYARFGDLSIFAIGLATFLSLAVLSALARKPGRPVIDRLINLILVVGLASEGFFMGYLAFRVHTVCLFCVAIFTFMTLLGLLRVLAGELDVVAGFAAFAAVFVLQYLVLPAGVPVPFSDNDKLVLFYSKDCKHCAEIMKELDERKIAVLHLEAIEYAGFLKSMHIDRVPTLLVNDQNQKTLLTGTDAIRRYLAACSQPTGTAPAAARQTPRPAAKTGARSTGPAVNLFSSPEVLSLPGPSTGESGMCKEDEICK